MISRRLLLFISVGFHTSRAVLEYTASGVFPVTAFSSYYASPTATSAQVQPVVSDAVNHVVYPLALTDPDKIPTNNTVDPHPLPDAASPSQLLSAAVGQLRSLATSPAFRNNTCAQCQTGLQLAKLLTLSAPAQGPTFFVEFCSTFNLSSTCNVTYALSDTGSVITQVVASADVGGYDGQAICQNFFSMCPAPPTVELELGTWFAKPKPSPLPLPKVPSGKRLKVLHISDLHLDPRYATASEANCSGSRACCRSNIFNPQSPHSVLVPAPRYGAYQCDSPLALALAALQAIPVLTNTSGTGFEWTLYTGDLASHEPDNQNSRAYVEYAETILYDLFKRMLGPGPIYATLGNHDTYSVAQDAPHSLGGTPGQQFTWNYDHLASLWEYEGWLNNSAASFARSHYAAYMVRRVEGLRIISLNTDLWYRANYFSYINMTNPDVSGMLRFLTDELQDAEDAGERAWIIGHVLTGWDGTNGLRNPTNLFYQIVDRFSPHVVAVQGIFFGHTHEDQQNIFYADNATEISSNAAVATSWIGPSLTPITNLNSGFRMYEIDSNTFEILDAYTWKSDVNSFPNLDSQTAIGPTYSFEYSTREAYGATITQWGPNDPLNATWWHLVTEAMEANSSLVTTFNTFQGKSSILTPPCTGDCIAAKICYIRSGSAPVAMKNCKLGYGSVQ